MDTTVFEVRGHKVRTTSRRRYQLVCWDKVGDKPVIGGRTDSREVAIKRMGDYRHCEAVTVVDAYTGEDLFPPKQVEPTPDPGDMHGADGSLIGRKDMSDAELLAPLLEEPEVDPVIEAQIDEERQRLHGHLAACRRNAKLLDPKYKRAEEKAHRLEVANLATLDAGKSPTKAKMEQADAARREADRFHKQLTGVFDAITRTKAQIAQLDSPRAIAEREAKLETRQRLGNLKERTMADKTKKATAKDQGFPSVYLNDKGAFRPGMDARAKSDLICKVLGITSKDSILPANVSAAKAEELIQARGWVGFLTRKREILAEREAAAAAKAEAKKNKPKPAAKKRSSKKPAARGVGKATSGAEAKAAGETVPDAK